ncbi:MAG: undecaprenyl-diphosphate phosphatase [bacterium]|nr:undecaprenyl-diphosphate phosphatase [bacterium]
MNELIAAVLGLVQGLTEFIPVSSSAHLVLIPELFHWEPAGMAFDTVLHLGTLLALVAFFGRDILDLFAAFGASLKDILTGKNWRQAVSASAERRLAWLVLLGTLPAVVIGVSFKSALERLFEAPLSAAAFLMVTGVMIWYVGSRKNEDITGLESSVSPRVAILVGLAQAFAMLPGISRSGATISAGLFLGLGRETAPRFSFLLAIPAIAGAAVLQAKDLHQLAGEAWLPLLIGGVVAAVSGYLAIFLVFRSLQSHKFKYFACYCWLLGIFMLGRILWT